MPRRDYEALVAYLRDRFGDDLRWVASFDSARFDYTVRYVREDLKTDLTDSDLDTVVHRSMAVFDRAHVERPYAHLGDVRSLVVDHERATAVHLYLEERRGVVVKVQAGRSVTLPDVREACLARLGG